MTSHPHEPGESAPASPPRVLARIRHHVAELASTLWAARPGAELMETVAEIEALRSTLDALELAVLVELEATGAAKTAGWASTQDFTTYTAGGHRGHGPATLRLARATTDPVLAPVAEAMADGWLSATKAHVIARGIETLPGNPALRARGVSVLLDHAKALDATELRHLTRRLTNLVDPDGEERREERALAREERVAHLHRHLSIRDDRAGGAWISGRCSSEDAALIKTALIPLTRPHPVGPSTCSTADCDHDNQYGGCGGPGGRDPRDHGARMLDALSDLCRHALSSELLPDAHGATPRVTVTIDLDHLRHETGVGTTETGETLPASTVRRMACDADLVPAVLGTDSVVLDVGRTQRLVTPAIWRALVTRDRHCRFPHCTRPPVMDHAHHLQHWADGGPTSLDNLILLCGHHHRLIHAGPWTIHRTGPSAFAFDPPPGVRAPHPSLPSTHRPIGRHRTGSGVEQRGTSDQSRPLADGQEVTASRWQAARCSP